MLVLGYVCLLIQILIYVWAVESPFIGVSVVVMAVFILSPFLSFVESSRQVRPGTPTPPAGPGDHSDVNRGGLSHTPDLERRGLEGRSFPVAGAIVGT